MREGEGYLGSRYSRYTSEMRRQTRSGLAVTASSYMYQGGRCREKCKGDCQDIIASPRSDLRQTRGSEGV